MEIASLDHLVLTVNDIDATCDFYHQILGMEVVTFNGGRKALHFGQQKINLHQAGQELSPRARQPTPGSADLCFLLSWSLDEMVDQLEAYGIPIEEGPVQRTGAEGQLLSVYIRDPEGNLLELAEPMPL